MCLSSKAAQACHSLSAPVLFCCTFLVSFSLRIAEFSTCQHQQTIVTAGCSTTTLKPNILWQVNLPRSSDQLANRSEPEPCQDSKFEPVEIITQNVTKLLRWRSLFITCRACTFGCPDGLQGFAVYAVEFQRSQ